MVATTNDLYVPASEADMSAMPEWIWRGLNAFAVHSLFHTANLFDMMRAESTERTTDVEIARDITYSSSHTSWRKLDVWRPATAREDDALRPAVLFIHGGGFRTMSRKTHWYFARALARMGYVVFSIDYRLGPEHPYPAGIKDAARALTWVNNHAVEHGADVERMVFAGESAGGNLATSLALMTCYERPEPWANRVYQLGITPKAVLPMCGLLQVTDPHRYARAGASKLVMFPLEDAAKSYVPEHVRRADHSLDMADPLLWLEQGQAPKRALPPMFATVGTKDPLVEDSERLVRAVERLGGRCEMNTYRGGSHSFMAFMWTRKARQCWRDMRTFLDDTVPATSSPRTTPDSSEAAPAPAQAAG